MRITMTFHVGPFTVSIVIRPTKLRIKSGCPNGARTWRISFFAWKNNRHRAK